MRQPTLIAATSSAHARCRSHRGNELVLYNPADDIKRRITEVTDDDDDADDEAELPSAAASTPSSLSAATSDEPMVTADVPPAGADEKMEVD